jgi:hypothetical protein
MKIKMKNPLHKSMIRIASFFVLCLTITAQAQPELSADELRQKLEQLYSNNSEIPAVNKTFVNTDKDIYAPGDIIHFKAEVMDVMTQMPTQTTDLIVMVRFGSGQILFDEKHTLIQGIAIGAIRIPENSPEGFAYFVAFTPCAQNHNDASLAALKTIYIGALGRADFVTETKTSAAVLSPGNDFQMDVTLHSLGTSTKKEKINAELYDFDRSLAHEKRAIRPSETTQIRFKIPPENEGGLHVDLTVGDNPEKLHRTPVYTTNDNIHIEFFPEGGHLLSNSVQKIVYRATDAFGQPLSINGNVYDKNHHHVGMGKSIKPGFGIISMMPTFNQEYTFEIENKPGKDRRFVLPEVTRDGVAFTYQRRDQQGIRNILLASGQAVGSTVYVAAVANGEVRHIAPVTLKSETEIRFSPESLSPGINLFLVYDTQGTLLSDRLVYVDPAPQLSVQIQLETETVKPQDPLKISIEAKHPQTSNNDEVFFDISVVDAHSLFVKPQPLFKSNLRYPLDTELPQTVVDLYLTNLELIANTVVNYGIHNLKNPSQSELRLTTLTGTVVDKKGKPVPQATVMFMNTGKPSVSTTKTNGAGRFKFEQVAKTDEMKFKAFGSNEKKTFQVKIDHSFEETLENRILRESFMNNEPYRMPEIRHYFENHAQAFAQLVPKTKKTTPKSPGYEQLLQSGTEILSVIKMMKPFNLINNQIVFMGGQNSLMNQTGALIVIDGNKMGTDISAFNSISPSSVETINILTDPTSMQLYTALNPVGVIVITTKGVKNDKEAYYQSNLMNESPKLSANELDALRANYATTLHYETGLKGQLNTPKTLEFETNKLKSKFVIRVKAYTTNGFMGYAEKEFSTLAPAQGR